MSMLFFSLPFRVFKRKVLFNEALIFFDCDRNISSAKYGSGLVRVRYLQVIGNSEPYELIVKLVILKIYSTALFLGV